MGSKQKDLTGLKFNNLNILFKVKHNEDKSYRKIYWKCLCDCGKETILSTSQIISNKTKSCGCLRKITNASNSIKSRYKMAKKDSGYKSIYNSYLCNAKAKNKIFEIEFEDFKNLLIGNCFYCNSEPLNVYMKSYYNVKYNGVDRRNNDTGYTLENSVSCCKMCNIAKNNNTEENFKNWIVRVYNNLEKLKELQNEK